MEAKQKTESAPWEYPQAADRRAFLAAACGGLGAAAGLALDPGAAWAQMPGERPERPGEFRVIHPRGRVPVSWIIDDSTCLVNLNRFAIPQFATAWGGGPYDHDWQSMPAEIPDAFVREFGTWCQEHGVRGKYSIVPYPACVGRLDRVLPGWSRRQVDESLALVRSLMMPSWDIHPEMVTHTWVIDTSTGHPYPERTLRYMENWQWTDGRSVDELANYFSYALKILKNVDLPCEGITTPGGFGNRVLPELAQATLQSCRDVFAAEIPHYFRHLYDSGDRSVSPRVEYAANLQSSDPRCVVSIIGCTGDWTGGWDCRGPLDVDRFITADLSDGRLVQVIDRGEPAVMVCHWTGIYDDGRKRGFQTFQEVVRRLHAKYDQLMWMRTSELARYWAARELTAATRHDQGWTLVAPFACPSFTVEIPAASFPGPPQLDRQGARQPLEPVATTGQLRPGTCMLEDGRWRLCWDLLRGTTRLLQA